MREKKAKEYLSTIYMLASYGAVRASYIAREMMLSRPSVSVAIKALEKDGYITVDSDHLIHLTELGERKAEESICETVNRGNNFRSIARQIQGEQVIFTESTEKRKQDHLLSLLVKDQSARILEAILILSKRYYSVRIIDISQFLGRSSAFVRSALNRLEKYGLVNRGEETTVKLSENGNELADHLYRQHESIRNELMQNGFNSFEAEQKSLSCQD